MCKMYCRLWVFEKIGIDLSGIVCEDVIGICRRMYVLCFVGYI